MDLTAAAAHWVEHGYVFLPGYLPADQLVGAQREAAAMFPSVEQFFDNPDDPGNAPYRDGQFAGITPFPFEGVELGLLALHPAVVALAEAILESDDIRLYGCEAWAKFAGAADYEQDHHRDLAGHTPLAASSDPRFRQVEMFIYLNDVAEGAAPTRFVSKTLTRGLPVRPRSRSRHDSPELYDAEVSCPGPAGTVVAWSVDTFHRAVSFTDPRAARFTLQANFRGGAAEWMTRIPWGYVSNGPEWHRFVEAASPRHLLLLGFPPPGHPYWTDETLAGMAERYPNLDLAPWRQTDA